jgi:hypothetical protein
MFVMWGGDGVNYCDSAAGVRRTACGACTVVRFTFWPFVFAWIERVFEVNQAGRGLDACRLSLALACVSQLACRIHRTSFFIAPAVLFIGCHEDRLTGYYFGMTAA